jgi:rare lipoprotein A
MKKATFIFAIISVLFLSQSFTKTIFHEKNQNIQNNDSIKKLSYLDSIYSEGEYNYKLYKNNAHASYYAQKFTGKKTSSGRIFDNNKLYAAHRTFAFGTKLRLTNPRNGKFVIVEVVDRGPFVKGREIDVSQKAFMEITSNKGSGEMMVKIEVQIKI